jgi:hypothetical protein
MPAVDTGTIEVVENFWQVPPPAHCVDWLAVLQYFQHLAM